MFYSVIQICYLFSGCRVVLEPLKFPFALAGQPNHVRFPKTLFSRANKARFLENFALFSTSGHHFSTKSKQNVGQSQALHSTPNFEETKNQKTFAAYDQRSLSPRLPGSQPVEHLPKASNLNRVWSPVSTFHKTQSSAPKSAASGSSPNIFRSSKSIPSRDSISKSIPSRNSIPKSAKSTAFKSPSISSLSPGFSQSRFRAPRSPESQGSVSESSESRDSILESANGQAQKFRDDSDSENGATPAVEVPKLVPDFKVKKLIIIHLSFYIEHLNGRIFFI